MLVSSEAYWLSIVLERIAEVGNCTTIATVSR